MNALASRCSIPMSPTPPASLSERFEVSGTGMPAPDSADTTACLGIRLRNPLPGSCAVHHSEGGHSWRAPRFCAEQRWVCSTEHGSVAWPDPGGDEVRHPDSMKELREAQTIWCCAEPAGGGCHGGIGMR